MKYNYKFLLFCFLALASCKQVDTDIAEIADETGNSMGLGRFVAEADGATRLGLSKDGSQYLLKWNADDEIAIYADNYLVKKSIYTTSDDNTMSAEFKYSLGRDFSKYVAPKRYFVCSPASALSFFSLTKYDTAYTVSFPNLQSYVPNSIDENAFVMCAVTPDDHLQFKAQNAVLKLRVKDCTPTHLPVNTIQKVVIRSAEDMLAGTFALHYANGEYTPKVISGASNIVTLDCGEDGVELSRSDYTDFYISIPTMTFSSKFTVMLHNSDSEVALFSTAAGFIGKTVEAGKVYPITLNPEVFGRSIAVMDNADGGETISLPSFATQYCGGIGNVEKIEYRTSQAPPSDSVKSIKTAQGASVKVYLSWNPSNKTMTISTPQSILQYRQPKSFPDMFKGMTGLKEIDMAELDLSNFKNAEVSVASIFEGCTSIDTIDFATINLPLVSNFQAGFKGCTDLKYVSFSNPLSITGPANNLFVNCSNLQTVNMEKVDVSECSKMSSMFKGCTALKTVDLSTFSTPKVTDFSFMFGGCTALDTIDLSSFTTESLTTAANMFNGCTTLKYIDISGMDLSSVNTGAMFNNCPNVTNLIFGKNCNNLSSSRSNMFTGFATNSASCKITCTAEMKAALLEFFNSVFSASKFTWDILPTE